MRKSHILVTDDLAKSDKDSQKLSTTLQGFASDLAALFGCKTDLAYIHNLPSRLGKLLSPEERQKFISIEKAKHEGALKNFVNPGELLIKIGWPMEEISKLAEDQKYSAIVMGTKGAQGAERFFLGSVAEEVVRNVKEPTYIIGPAAVAAGYKMNKGAGLKLIVATDLTKHSRAAEAYAVGLAKKLGTTVHLYYSLKESLDSVQKFSYIGAEAAVVFDDVYADIKKEATEGMAKKIERLKAAGVKCEGHVDSENASLQEGLLKLASGPDSLVFMGHQARGFIGRTVLGSNLRHIIATSKVPVAVVRS